MLVSTQLYCKNRAKPGVYTSRKISLFLARACARVAQKESRLRFAGGAASEGWKPCLSE